MFTQPVAPGDPRWEITLQARANDVVVTHEQLEELREELRRAAALCSFLREQPDQTDPEARQHHASAEQKAGETAPRGENTTAPLAKRNRTQPPCPKNSP